ncbi:Homeobox domain-containing protein [Trichostrongylus colubriformis]|uniref:Homeobox domain-containing protein n=1 Tax=Trichostrongylus colubriformis TaxID=6319 RepID=A0AAN8FEC0_TRICO
MLLLVNVERHQEVLGKIVADLVKYGVPVSLVAGTDRICTRCSFVEKLSSKQQEVNLLSLASSLPQGGIDLQSSTAEIKDEAVEDRHVDGDCESETSFVTATPTSAATNKVDQAIKRALRVYTPLTGLMALPLGFFTPSCDRETSGDTSKNGSGCEEEDFRTCNGTSSTAEDKPRNVSQAAINAHSMTKCSPDNQPSPQNSATKARTRKRRDRPLSLTKSGAARKGRKTYTDRDLQILEEFYLRDPFACGSPDKRQTLCRMLDIDPYRLKVWFQNRRRKDKLCYSSQKSEDV